MSKKSPQWPSSGTPDPVPGDDRTWGALNEYLRARGTSLSARVERLRGTPPHVKEWTIDSLRVAVSVYVSKHGKQPTASSTDVHALPPGGTWHGGFQWARKHGYSLDDVRGGPLHSFFETVEEFSSYIQSKRVSRWDDYKRLHKAKKLDPRCPSSPMDFYRTAWRQILGRSKFTKSELLKYLVAAKITGYDIRTSSGYHNAHKQKLLDPRCPEGPRARYPHWEWPRSVWHPTGKDNPKARHHSIPLLKKAHGLLRNGKSYRQVVEITGLPRHIIVRIGQGIHWSCREGALR